MSLLSMVSVRSCELLQDILGVSPSAAAAAVVAGPGEMQRGKSSCPAARRV